VDTILELRQLTKRYVPASAAAVDGISLEIRRGELFSLLGPSGCGKTTTLRLIAGFEDPTSGEVWLDGARIDQKKPYERNVTTVFQNYALFPHLTVQQNVEFGLRRRGAGDCAAKALDVLKLVQLTGKEARLPSQLSGGEKQRVALARSLVLSPDVLLLDEPLSALDPRLRKQVRAELKDLQRRVGVTFLLITHDQEEALSLSDRIAVMNRGRVEQVGTPEEIYLKPATRFVASFLGAMNWLCGAGVRPEATRIGAARPDSPRAFRARVVGSTFLGNCVHVETRLESGDRAIAEVPRVAQGTAGFAVGESVFIWWNAEDELALPESPRDRP
jgi:ABC-type Fe3+/spermidine/putrescine transport system ATPase subunit